jgi:hypothetical protein
MSIEACSNRTEMKRMYDAPQAAFSSTSLERRRSCQALDRYVNATGSKGKGNLNSKRNCLFHPTAVL